MNPEAVLATNTSSIPLEILNTCLTRPERLIGMHFFNPVAQMQLVEIIAAPATDRQFINKGAAFVRAIDRLPLPVTSSPGFLVNRVLMPYLMEAVALQAGGTPVEAIDASARRFGMPMGPLELADTIGLDVCLYVGEILAQHLGKAVPPSLRERVQQGRLGRKSGAGFYEYHKGKPKRQGVVMEPAALDRLADQMVQKLLDEADACLREAVVDDADLVDAGMIFGTGFAPFRGGPLHYAASRTNPL
jgi:3-hydroxyacyl-CoA dehydrogenase/enoyl-CoA hydratase/3-hydroxybutyryl-CoA epimerase